ncbi:hypothetical protein ACJJTC_002039 [Scirpophaga incertulas]
MDKFFQVIGLERNRAKSATNSESCSQSAVLLNVSEGYKYLGITENRNSEVSKETCKRIHEQILMRVERICNGLNGKNTINAINEYALSLINYYIGAVPMEHADYMRIYDDIRKILIKQKIHLQPANTERLYLPRKELGRGLCNLVHKSEKIELQLYKTLFNGQNTSLRRSAILKTMQEENSSTAIIESYLRYRYSIEGEIDINILESAQKASLYNEIHNKTLHEKLYRLKKNELVDIEKSSPWLTNGNISAKEEGRLCYLQDRNMFGGAPGLCQHCKERPKSVDHLASQCNRMLGIDYTQVNANSDVEIRVDTTVATSTKQSANRPDILIYDKKRRLITIIEVGITSQDQLTIVENEKKRKYDVLANEMGSVHKCKTRIIPYVLTWDGIVTVFHKSYAKEIGLTTKIQSYIQFIVLKKTLESISYEYRREGVEIIPRWREKSELDRMKSLEAPDGELSVKQETIS